MDVSTCTIQSLQYSNTIQQENQTIIQQSDENVNEIVILMIVNRRNWQSYLSFQIAMILFSLIPVILNMFGYMRVPVLAYLALAVAVFLFLGTVIIGGKRATTELKRRFHVK